MIKRKITSTYFDAPKLKTKFSEPEGKSKGILDDYATRKNIATKEGSIEHVPTAYNHIVNKRYVDKIVARFVDFDVPGAAYLVGYNIIDNIIYDSNFFLSSARYMADAVVVAALGITYDARHNPSVITIVSGGTTYESTFTYIYDDDDNFTKVSRADTEA